MQNLCQIFLFHCSIAKYYLYLAYIKLLIDIIASFKLKWCEID